MKNQSTVTIIIAAYQRPDALNRALKSVYVQTHCRWTVLIIADSCSNEFLSKVDLSDNRVALINLPERCGNQYGPNSVGLHFACSDYIAFLNHDDIWLPDHLEIATKHLEQQKANFFMGKAAFCFERNQTNLAAAHGRLIFSEYNRPEAIWRCTTGPFYYFEPASSWVISTAFAKQVMPWRPPNITAPIPPIQDFIKRAARHNAKFYVSNKLSVLKLNLHCSEDKSIPHYNHISEYTPFIDALFFQTPDTIRIFIDQDIEKAEERGLFFREDLRRELTLDSQEQKNILSFLIYKNTGIEMSEKLTDTHKATAVDATSVIKARTGEHISSFQPASKIIASLTNRSSETYIQPIVSNIDISHCNSWRIGENSIHSLSNRYFSIIALRSNDCERIYINQPEIGILGLIVAQTNSNSLWLMQKKPEPGNINYYQLAPTVQATPSNYQRVHGGDTTPFLESFTGDGDILIDVEASEQGDIFLNKFNRNVKCIIPERFDLLEQAHRFCWLESNEVKKLLRQSYAINTDSRSVIATGNWSLLADSQIFFSHDLPWEYATAFNASYNTIYQERIKAGQSILELIYNSNRQSITYIKMNNLEQHYFDADGLYTKSGKRVIGFYNIFMPDREVQWWQQPLIESTKLEHCILLFTIYEGIAYFYISAYPETGFFGRTEFGPTIQTGPGLLKQNNQEALDILEKSQILAAIDQSDEGGRFYRNITRYTVARWRGSLDGLKASHRIWMTLGEIEYMSLHKGVLTNELRTAISILLSYA